MDCPKEGRRDRRVQRPMILPRQRAWQSNPEVDESSVDERTGDDELELLRESFPWGPEYEALGDDTFPLALPNGEPF
jgi:hypothetical protein